MNAACRDWGDAPTLLTIARCGTLGAEAKHVGQTQPDIGRRLRALKEAPGHTPLQPTSDGLVLAVMVMIRLVMRKVASEFKAVLTHPSGDIQHGSRSLRRTAGPQF